MSLSYKNKKFPCKECGVAFNRSDHRDRHFLIHSDDRLFSCSECNRSFKRKDHLDRHSSTHSKFKPFSCEICDKRFARNYKLKLHIQNHLARKSFKCKKCGTGFKTKYHLKRHDHRVHAENKSSIRKKVGKALKLKTLKNQVRIYKKHKPFTSDKNEKLKSKNGLKVNFISHVKDASFKCNECGQTFIKKYLLKRHSVIHSEKKTVIDQEEKVFGGRSSRRKSSLCTESLDELFSCTKCQKSFYYRYHLKSHLRTHLKKDSFSCDKCGREFTEESNLKNHLTTQCQSKLATDDQSNVGVKRYSLRKHVLSNDEKNLFPCSKCDKAFNKKSSLVLHLHSHRKDKSFSCTKCEKMFIREHNLKRHSVIHSREISACDEPENKHKVDITADEHLCTGERNNLHPSKIVDDTLNDESKFLDPNSKESKEEINHHIASNITDKNHTSKKAINKSFSAKTFAEVCEKENDFLCSKSGNSCKDAPQVDASSDTSIKQEEHFPLEKSEASSAENFDEVKDESSISFPKENSFKKNTSQDDSFVDKEEKLDLVCFLEKYDPSLEENIFKTMNKGSSFADMDRNYDEYLQLYSFSKESSSDEKILRNDEKRCLNSNEICDKDVGLANDASDGLFNGSSHQSIGIRISENKNELLLAREKHRTLDSENFNRGIVKENMCVNIDSSKDCSSQWDTPKRPRMDEFFFNRERDSSFMVGNYSCVPNRKSNPPNPENILNNSNSLQCSFQVVSTDESFNISRREELFSDKTDDEEFKHEHFPDFPSCENSDNDLNRGEDFETSLKYDGDFLATNENELSLRSKSLNAEDQTKNCDEKFDEKSFQNQSFTTHFMTEKLQDLQFCKHLSEIHKCKTCSTASLINDSIPINALSASKPESSKGILTLFSLELALNRRHSFPAVQNYVMCSYCGIAFKRHGDLQKHLRTHRLK